MRPHELKELRLYAGLTQEQAAKMVYCSLRQWIRFEQGDFTSAESKANYLARSELFAFKVKGSHTDISPVPEVIEGVRDHLDNLSIRITD